MAPVEELAAAKINLDLWVIGRRADGYHELDSLVVFAPPCDRLRFQAGGELTLEVTGPFAAALAGEPDNLVLRAARRLAERVGRAPEARITLDKRIPVAAGLGGGSADAAAALRGLNRLWRLDLSAVDLAPLAGELGADVPVCLASRPTRMRGVGERLEPIDGLPELAILLVNPCQPIATAAVFAGLAGPFEPPPELGPPPGERRLLLEWLRARANHLEEPARRLLPAVGAVLDAIGSQHGCQLARMSGSGATCFGLFDSSAALAPGASALAKAHPEWWVMTTRTAAP
ncbi:MAG TPA: 4-(cytidine 5'-diphospho)-2-C-methyl-D-erythritol kinase [Geminicoccaceae bacterium]|nr:4-(cytidine 5'-diphospho)-2-C-methyl-D-erythritol kinase [Geminicoccaceae bacterium]